MNFEHTEERRMLADTLDRFIGDRGIEARNAVAHTSAGFSPELWRGFAELGAVGALFNEDDGGLGGGGFDIAVVFEALGRGLVVEPFLGNLMVGRGLSAAGQERHKTVLQTIVEGSAIVALAHEEPASRYELAAVTTKAERAQGRWTLNGAKAVVRHAEASSALLVSVRTHGNDRDTHGITLFLIDADSPGVSMRGYNTIDGGRAAEITLLDVTVDDAAIVGEVGQGHSLLQTSCAAGLLALCAEALGIMDAMKSATLDYLRARRQFNVPIGSFQALQHRMATLLLEIEQARSSVINAAAAFDTATERARDKVLSAAKFSIGRIGTLVTEECIQMHGGIGMTWELALGHYAKRLIMIDHQLGDEDHHLEQYIAAR